MFNIYVMCLLSISYLIQFKETEKGCGRPKITLVEMIFNYIGDRKHNLDKVEWWKRIHVANLN